MRRVTLLRETSLGVWLLLVWVVLMLLALPWLAGHHRHRAVPRETSGTAK